MHHLGTTFNTIKNFVNEILGDDTSLFRKKVRPGPRHQFTDIDIMALSLTADSLGVNSENYLFAALNSDYKEWFPKLLSRRQYNDRKRRLKEEILSLQQLISDKFRKARKSQDIYVIDSAPLRICRTSRGYRSTVCKDDMALTPNIGWCAAQEEWYYGFRLHIVCTAEGIVKAFKVENPNLDEREYLYEIADEFKGCRIVGDKGYISKERKNYLLNNYRIALETPYRKNMKNPKPFLYSKQRKRIETLFSQLNDQFQMQRNYAKTVSGYITRIYSKLCSLTLLQFINKVKGRQICKLQYALVHAA